MFSVLAALVTLGGLVNAQGYVTLPFTKETLDSNFSKREIVGNLEEQRTTYTVDFSLGNQPQKAFLETGTTEVWVYSTKVPIAFTYDPSSAHPAIEKFNMTYANGKKAEGSIYRDALALGDTHVTGHFGVVDTYDRSSRFGKFGLGLVKFTNGAIDEDEAYHSFPFILKNVGETEAAAYSLNLNPKDSSAGNVVFGAVDKARYTGQFQMLNGQSDDHFAVHFTLDGSSLIGALDTGSIYTFLPDDIVSRLATSMGAWWNQLSNMYMVDRKYIKQDLVFDFAGTKITMNASDLVDFPEFGPMGLLTVVPASQRDGRIILGDSFLKTAYTVYDLDNNRVAIAQASRNDSPPDYQPITSAGIPGALF